MSMMLSNKIFTVFASTFLSTIEAIVSVIAPGVTECPVVSRSTRAVTRHWITRGSILARTRAAAIWSPQARFTNWNTKGAMV